MSYRYDASFIDPGLNTLVAPTPTYTYGLWSWGNNSSGELGLGNTTYYSSPKQVGALENWDDVNCGNAFSIAVKTDGTMWGWGANSQGQLGLGNTTQYSSPKQIGALTGWLQAAGGYDFSIAVKTNGTLWSWGRNDTGQLAQGNTTSTSSPVQVGALTNWLQVAAGNYFAVAIKTDGTIWSWGRGATGRLGLGNTTSYSSPKQIGSLTNWRQVTTFCRSLSCLAVKTDGTLWAWGNNAQGQLGQNNITDRSSPVQVGALTTWSYVNNSFSSVRAITTTGQLYVWGSGSQGQLGLGNTTSYSSPKQVGALTNWLGRAAGGYGQSFVLKTDGTAWSWGFNSAGSLGLGDTTNRSSPVQIGSSTNWYDVFSGNQQTIALRY